MLVIKDGRRCCEESIDATEKNISVYYFWIFHRIDIASLDHEHGFDDGRCLFHCTRAISREIDLRFDISKRSQRGRATMQRHRSFRSRWRGKTGRVDRDRDRGTTNRSGPTGGPVS